MLINEILFIELILMFSLFFYTVSSNLLVLLYTGCIYLVFLGLLLLMNDADLYTGFLWVIDLGVGLVFFIFILHYTLFLYQKSALNLTYRYFYMYVIFVITNLILFYWVSFKSDYFVYGDLCKTWFFKITYTDYYTLYNTVEVTDLNLLKDSYFLLNSFEFYAINFSLLFGLLAAIILYFIIQRSFNFMNFTQIIYLEILSKVDSGFFIKTQDFIRQQNTPGVVRVWAKGKSTSLA